MADCRIIPKQAENEKIGYISKYLNDTGLTYQELAAETCTTQSSIARYFIDSDNSRQPSRHQIRVIQLLSFIKNQGLEPPPPIY